MPLCLFAASEKSGDLQGLAIQNPALKTQKGPPSGWESGPVHGVGDHTAQTSTEIEHLAYQQHHAAGLRYDHAKLGNSKRLLREMSIEQAEDLRGERLGAIVENRQIRDNAGLTGVRAPGG